MGKNNENLNSDESEKKRQTISQSCFRNKLIKTYRKCVVSGYHESECDAAHIIPLHVCIKLNLDDCYYNGLLLSKSLHVSFDKFLWTLDLFDLIEIPNTNFVKLGIITIDNRHSLIGQYYHDYINRDMYVKVHRKSLPYIFIHYKMYLEIHCHGQSVNLELYNQCLNDPDYINLKNKTINIHDLSSREKIPVMILKKKQKAYKVWHKYRPKKMATWIHKKDLSFSRNLIKIYHEKIEKKNDPDYN
jgi:hypothetical protein